MADLFKFVDSVAASPTVRLDMNDGVTWLLSGPSVDFSPPPLRRAINGTLLTDGSMQSASSYDNRLLRFTLELATGATDATATQLQLLNRELDRDSNTIMWQPSGATSPVFFRTLRTPITQVQVISPLNTSEAVHVEILAEPFALGLREDVAVGTVNNDPAAGSNGHFYDVTGVKGDVGTPAFIENTATATSRNGGVLAMRQHGTPSDLTHFLQSEALTLGTDTTNPGGGPDAAMSGAGTNNFVRTSFATAPFATRLTWTPAPTVAQAIALRGTFRVFAVVRRSDNTSAMSVWASTNVLNNIAVVLPLSTARNAIDLGLVTMGQVGPVSVGRYSAESPPLIDQLYISAQRDSGTGTLDWDYLLLVPADESLLLWAQGGGSAPGTIAGESIAVDGPSEAIYGLRTTASPFAGTVVIDRPMSSVAGGFPQLLPGQTNRLIYAQWATASTGISQNTIAKADTATITVSYWPRYLHARPAST